MRSGLSGLPDLGVISVGMSIISGGNMLSIKMGELYESWLQLDWLGGVY